LILVGLNGQMLYQDFDLLIDQAGDNLRAVVVNSPAGQATAEFRLPFSDDKLENFLLRLGRPRRPRRVESSQMTTAQTFGAALFNAVFSGDVKACFRSSLDEARQQNVGLRMRLRLTGPAVVDLPWEFLYNPAVNRFLGLSVHTPLVRYVDLPQRIQPISMTLPIRVLVVLSSPTDYPALDVEAEWTRLNESLADLISKNQIAVERLGAATLGALQRRLRREPCHILHFVGHGELDDRSQKGGLILEGEQGRGHSVSSEFLGMMLHDHESLGVAVLIMSEGTRTSGMTNSFADSAQNLVRHGVSAVVAMQFEIADDVASRFAHEFYGAVADGYPVDASLTEARKSIFASGHEVEWGTPALYMRTPDGRVFDINTAVQPRHLSAAVVASEPLHELSREHQLDVAERQEQRTTAIREHLTAASELLAAGELASAWGRACDAISLDPADPESIQVEQRIRRMLDEQVVAEHPRRRTQLFLCYRRDDSQDATGRLYDRLVDRFGSEHVFMDIDNVPLGVNFITHITEQLRVCAAVLVVIGRSWANIVDDRGVRRLDDPADHVRVEIASALKQSLPVIPILVQDSTMPRVSDLPADIQELALHNALRLTTDYWRTGVSRLIRDLERLLKN
jgi:hypothetical protein